MFLDVYEEKCKLGFDVARTNESCPEILHHQGDHISLLISPHSLCKSKDWVVLGLRKGSISIADKLFKVLLTVYNQEQGLKSFCNVRKDVFEFY